MRRLHHTVERSVEIAGTGIHSGAPCRVAIHPAAFGSGIRFQPWGGGPDLPALVCHATAVPGCTVLATPDGGFRVGTPEHLLAAAQALGYSDLRIEVDGPELPALDGSAAPWCALLKQAGRRSGPRRSRRVLLEPVRVERGSSWAAARPCEQERLRVEVDHGPGLRGVQEWAPDEGGFVEEVAWARTYVMQRDIERLRASGRGRGADATNTVVYGEVGPLVDERGPAEGVRHKLLDLVGDLALAGAPVLARVVVHRGSHALHHELVRAILGASRSTT